MNMTAAQNQKRIDDGAEFDELVVSIKADMHDELLAGDYYTLEYRENGKVVRTVFDGDNVVDMMIDINPGGFNGAVMMLSRDPLEGAKILHVLKLSAIEKVIDEAKIREDAEYRMELKASERNAA